MSARRRAAALVASLVLSASVAACGQSTPAPTADSATPSPGTETSTASPPSGTDRPSTEADGPSAPSPSAGDATSGPPASPDPYMQMLIEFDTADSTLDPAPSGTVTDVGFHTWHSGIGCGLQDGTVTCQLDERPAFTPPLDCHGLGAVGIAMSAGEDPRFRCMGDVESGGPVVKDGVIVSAGGIRCVPVSTAVTCIDDQGHGFVWGADDYLVTGEAAS